MGARQVYENQFGSSTVLWGSKQHDFGSIPPGGVESTTLTVPGAALGDMVVASLGLGLGGSAILHGSGPDLHHPAGHGHQGKVRR